MSPDFSQQQQQDKDARSFNGGKWREDVHISTLRSFAKLVLWIY